MAILGLLAGWSSETGASVTLFVTFFCLINFWSKKHLQTWMTVSFTALFIGFLFVVLAPGNAEQAKMCGFYPDASRYTLDAFVFRFNYAFLPIILREIFLFLPIIFYFVEVKKNADSTKFILTFLAASIIILCVMMCIPMFEQRAGFSSTIFLIVASTAALKEILPDLEKICIRHIKIFKVVATILIVGGILHMGACVYVYAYVHMQFNHRWEIIDANRNSDEIIVPPLEIPSWSESIIGRRTYSEYAIKAGDIGDSPEFFRNLIFAQYYGLKKL